MPVSVGAASCGSRVVKIAALPTATPASFTPCSSPHIHAGRDASTPTVQSGAASTST